MNVCMYCTAIAPTTATTTTTTTSTLAKFKEPQQQ